VKSSDFLFLEDPVESDNALIRF